VKGVKDVAKRISGTLFVIALGSSQHAAAQDVAPAQAPTAQEMYWNAVRASSGPIGMPQAIPDEARGPHFRPRPPVLGTVFGSVPYVAPEPVYVPVYMPGPVVYVPVPAAPPPAPEREAPPAPVTPAPRTPQKYYVIPDCYGGNRPPAKAALPDGCDITKLRVSEW
jgi:hypothetical protein